ncbi:hypothetical protein RZR97_12735 [Hydrogenimonas thermophila]|uniref:hypothetical protein n=1 Tax=Hydrogenimonas thermophila TaxID=223786 RepID=UPI0029373D08|nr:hypothetical protein [Hydrogenimonas thermophila]WOE69950.1 hypothetical protein RZR91_12740 [Hydrogenimonas thermophila]WOE72467.1 hypothetical protein RZR97_12735 [Hydrogenimonas thermophila]
MAKNLPISKQNSKVALHKAKNLISVTNKILSNKSNLTVQDDSWMYRLWEWADENGVSDFGWIENKYYDEGGYWGGLPREKEKLLSLTELYLDSNNLTELPKEIGNLTNLTLLDLSNDRLTKLPKVLLKLSRNKLTELPKEIGNLTNLTELWLENNLNLILTKEQKEWILTLEKNNCLVMIDDDLFNRS